MIWGCSRPRPSATPPSPNPPVTVEDEDFDPAAETPPAQVGAPATSGQPTNSAWISVFTPDDPTRVSAPSDASAEVMQDESGSFIRIRSGPSGSAIIFDVGQGVLEQIAGKKGDLDIIARAEEGQQTQIAIDCDFGELGDCGRKRFPVGYERGEILFEVELPAKAPGASGTIAINSDFDNKGKAIDVYELRVSISE